MTSRYNEGMTSTNNNTKGNEMTATQKEAVRLMNEHNVGCLVTKFGWTWPETCRKNEEAAVEVVRLLSTR